MTAQSNLEIPVELHALAERSIEQGRLAADALIGAAHRALDDAENRAGRVQGSARDAGRRVLAFAEDNVSAGFDFAARLATVRTLDEWVRLNLDFAIEQARRIAAHAHAITAEGAAASYADRAHMRFDGQRSA